jgi:hypothetical protein
MEFTSHQTAQPDAPCEQGVLTTPLGHFVGVGLPAEKKSACVEQPSTDVADIQVRIGLPGLARSGILR